jgi:hypothetical protein
MRFRDWKTENEAKLLGASGLRVDWAMLVGVQRPIGPDSATKEKEKLSGSKGILGQIGERNRKIGFQILAAAYEWIQRILKSKPKFKLFENKNLNFGSRIQIKRFWNPNQGLFGLKWKDLNQRFLVLRYLNSTQGFWIQREIWIFSEIHKFNKEDFEILL